MRITRSQLVVLALLGLALLFGQALQSRRNAPDQIVYAPIEGLPGWGRVAFDSITLPGGSATGALLVGLGEEGIRDQGIPAAFFTDVNCPNCQSLETKLKARRDRLDLTRVELPLLGPRSEDWARFVLALDLQDGAEGFGPRGDRGPAGGSLVGALSRAEAVGLNVTQIRADMAGPVVEDRLAMHFAAAETLGIWGTPALTIGSTLVLGDLRGDTLDQLIANEAGRPGGC